MKKIISIISILTIAFTIICLASNKVSAQTLTPVSFDKNTRYEVSKLYDEMPNTLEAIINIDENFKANGVIFGNQYNKAHQHFIIDAIDFSIFGNGNPRIGYKLPNGESKEYIFTEANVKLGRDVHVAIVRDSENKLISCYVDGVLIQSYESDFEDFIPTELFCIGSDNRTWDSACFNGTIKSLAIYSDARTQAEILKDKTSVDVNNNDLLSYYDLTKVYDDKIVDKSGNGYDANKTYLWLNDSGMDFDFSYSIDIIGDTQMVTYYHPDKLANIYDYIVRNVKTKKTLHVAGVGDITEKSTNEEWNLALSQINKLNNVVSYSMVRGNHDSVNAFNNIFSNVLYKKQYTDRYSVGFANTVHEFSSGQLDYLLITLDFGADDKVLEWANKVVEAHPHHNVIVTTHGYLDHYGGLIDKNYAHRLTGDPSAKNEGIDLWNKFISKHANITMVFCGHIGYPDIILNQMVGENGNIVSQIQVDHQEYEYYNEATGMIATLYFSEDGKTVNVEYYSPIKNQYYRARNQFTFNVNTIPRAQSTENVENDSNTGCNGAVIASITGISMLMCAVFIFRKRKNN